MLTRAVLLAIIQLGVSAGCNQTPSPAATPPIDVAATIHLPILVQGKAGTTKQPALAAYPPPATEQPSASPYP